MLTTNNLITFLQLREGFRKHAYDDKNPNRKLTAETEIEGTLTIGYGTTVYPDGRAVEWDDKVTKSEAVDYLTHYVAEEIEPALENLIHRQLASCQYDAIGSCLYQYGEGEVTGWNLINLINDPSTPWQDIAKEWFNGTTHWHGEPMFWGRRIMEWLMFAGLDWKAGANVPVLSDVESVTGLMGFDGELPKPEPIVHSELFEDPELEIPHPAKPKQVFYEYDDALLEEPQPVINDPTPETPITTSDANIMQLEALKKGVKLNISDLRPVIPAKEVTYLTETAKADLQVKRIQDSKRGKGYAKQQTAKEVGVATGLGAAAGMVGAAEPVIKVVDKYPSQTLAYVVVGLAVFAVIYFYYGKWQQQRGEDDATELLG